MHMDTLDAIKRMLEGSGMTAAALAKAVGRSRNSIYNMFSGKTDVRVGSLVDMAKATGYEIIARGHGEELVIEGVSADADRDKGPADKR